MICDVEFLDLSTRPLVDVEIAVERFKKNAGKIIEKIAPPSFFRNSLFVAFVLAGGTHASWIRIKLFHKFNKWIKNGNSA